MSTSISSSKAEPCYDVLVVGAGHAGANVAIALRQRKFAGRIGLLWEESGLPYERPPLSKDYLAGERPAERLLIRPRQFWDSQQIELLPARSAAALDASAHRLQLVDGESIGYRQLVWAAGGRARRLSCAGADLRGVHTVRSQQDVDQLRMELVSAGGVVVIGGGYIGLEVAATLCKLGKPVLVMEQAGRLLARVAGETVAQFYRTQHERHGVDIRLASAIAGIEGHEGRVVAVRLASGERVPTSIAIVGIGIEPITAPLIAAGAMGRDGVDVDSACRTSVADVFAIGDCAAQKNTLVPGGRVRIESVQNAMHQAQIVARFIVGEAPPAAAVPWFWSDQFDLRLQTVGISRHHDGHVVRGSPDSGSFSVIYLREEKVIALDCINSPRDFSAGKALVAAGATWGPDSFR
ncbi:MAG: FAD-dependent oxidoreductase [Pseudomonadota bacterium]